MTVQEAENKGYDPIAVFLGICNGEIEEPEEKEYIHPVHGKVVGTRFDPYHDVTIYEDGHEERYYIGD